MINKTNYLHPIFFIIFLLSMISCGDSVSESKKEQMTDLMDRAEKAKRNGNFNDPFDYNQAIVGLQTEIANQILTCENRNQLEKLRETIKINKKALEKLSFSDDDYGFKSSMLDLFSFYLSLANHEYPKILELKDQIEENQNDEDLIIPLYNRIVEIGKEIEKKEIKLSNAMESCQNKFAKKYKMEITENPLQDQINEADDDFDELEKLINN